MGIISKKLGQRIKELRVSKKFTQLRFAEELEMEASNLSKIERGIQIPKEESLIKIAKILDVSVKDLFDYEHFTNMQTIRKRIDKILDNADIKTLQKYYKILLNI